ncbi:MAG: hypothetical protein GY868_18635 [Deltaproteobacteria bacterium]|nr:hypothetical protein [Deltaproteobacteria bacterium]
MIGIYVGSGTSHSWTWFADLFDREGLSSISFLDESAIAAGRLESCDLFFISGGDTFAIADGLGKEGALAIEAFVSKGGRYVGACAGAYLVLHSSLEPLNRFNFVKARITNLTKNLPVPRRKAEKFCTSYGCQYVYHPVREAVNVKVLTDSGQAYEIKAPLYGGPALLESDDVEVMAEYVDFTTATEFLVDESLARTTMLGNVAAVKKSYGRGMFYLMGPHFEHPQYTEANAYLFSIIKNVAPRSQGIEASRGDCPATDAKQFRRFLSHISNARIAAMAMERSSYTWVVGKKVYDPERIRVFLEAVWNRARVMLKNKTHVSLAQEPLEELTGKAAVIVDLVRALRSEHIGMQAESRTAAQLFKELREITALFLSLYFDIKRQICNC